MVCPDCGVAFTRKQGPGKRVYCYTCRPGKGTPEDRASVNKISSNAHLLRKYKLTRRQYDNMLARQAGVCAICLLPERMIHNGQPRALAVDHDHECCPGQVSCGYCVRALLCARCNIGIFGDDLALLRAKVDYLESWRRKIWDKQNHHLCSSEG